MMINYLITFRRERRISPMVKRMVAEPELAQLQAKDLMPYNLKESPLTRIAMLRYQIRKNKA
jgi:hypothetical protein